MILEVNSFPKIFDSRVNQAYPPKKYFGPPIGGVRGVGGTSNQHPYQSFYRGFRICKNLGGPRCNNHVAACFRLVSPLEIQEEEEQEQQEKGCPMVIADPSDLGHGKKGA